MESPSALVSAGHVGHFVPPPEDSIYYEGGFLSTKAAPHPGVIKFEGVFVPPYVQVLNHDNGTFTIFGAWFSLVVETAKFLNYR